LAINMTIPHDVLAVTKRAPRDRLAARDALAKGDIKLSDLLAAKRAELASMDAPDAGWLPDHWRSVAE
jgi:hypothetical protein